VKLSSLHINAFRGATKPITLNFSQDKNISLIYAENGNGKSSIADALVCLCTDGAGSLDDKSNKDYSFLKSLGANNSDLLVELKTDTQTYKATLSANSNKIIKEPSNDLPKLKALRRAQITSFIEDTPSARYKVLSSFIDLSNIQKSEAELKKLIASLDRELGQNKKSLSDAKNTLTEIWNKEGDPLGKLNDWVQSEIKKDNSKLSKELQENNSVLQNWSSLQIVVSSIKAENAKYGIAKNNFSVAEKHLKEYQLKNPNAESDLLSVLNETKKFLIAKVEVDKCPVCEKDNEKQQLLQNVDGRIAKMQELNKLTQIINSAKTERDKLYNRLQGQIEPFNFQLLSFKTSAIKLSDFDFTDILSEISETNATKDNYKVFNDVYLQLTVEIEKLSKHNQTVNKSVGLHNSINSNYESIVKITKKYREIDYLLKQAASSLEILEDTRKKFIDSELFSISGEVETMYQEIHPNEGLGNVKLFLNHAYQSSLNLSANFHTESDITPQSVYSESHLDTLGLCIFIALAKKESNKDVILVLDDVVMSVDERHLDRIISLIHTEAKKFAHVFISTHYRPWRERYRNNRAPNLNIQFLELRGWSMERGITIAKPQLVLDEIKYYLSSPEYFHRENLSGATGRFLEAILDFLTFNFQSRLKRKPGNDYTLSELLDCLSKDLLKVLKVQRMSLLPEGKYCNSNFDDEVFLKPVIDEIKNLKAIRNQVGAHFTFEGALVSDNDIEDFAKSTIKLTELLVCPENGTLPDRNNSGSYWETKSGCIRLFPLSEP
jgi:recombinational DNA repair ATPase RecF